MIQFRQVSKQYKDSAKTMAVDGVDLSIQDGEFVFIVGDSGAGKSTLLKLMMGLERPTGGNILVDGLNVSQIKRSKLPEYRRRFGCIFQDFQLLKDFTAYENVAFAQRVIGTKNKNIRKRVPKALADVGLEGKEKSYPSQLSGGEQQRVAIARALVNGPLYLIADEPTGNLDQTNTDEVMALLEALNRTGTTVIVITHDTAVVERMQKRVVELKDGRIVSDTAWHAAQKATESVQPVPDNIELTAPAPALPTEQKEEAVPQEAAEELPTESEVLPEEEEDEGYVQERLDLGEEEEPEEEPEQVEMDIAAITPPQLPEIPPLVVPKVDLPESDSARKSRVVSEVLKGWTAPTEEAAEVVSGDAAVAEPAEDSSEDAAVAEAAEDLPAEAALTENAAADEAEKLPAEEGDGKDA